MDFSLTPEHELIRESAAQFAKNVVVPGIAERDRNASPAPGFLKELGKSGLAGVSIPAKYGGSDTDYISLGIVCEELERGDTSARVVLSVHSGLHCMTLLQWGTEEQKQRWLPALASGEKIGAFGLTEPNAGSDAINISTRAKRDGSDYILNGEKTWISLSDYADQFLVIAKLEGDGERGESGENGENGERREIRESGGSGERGSVQFSQFSQPSPSSPSSQSSHPSQPSRPRFVAFIVDRSAPGFSSRPIHGKLGVRAGNTGSIFFDDVRVPAENRIGEEGDGFKVAMSALDHGRYTVASGAVGIIQACLDACIPYCHDRKVGGEEIGRKQLVQQMIASMVQSREIGRLLYYKVGWMKNQGLRHTREVSLAKWTNCAAAFDAAHKAIEIHGAYGFCDEFPVERYFRNSRGAMIYEGTHEIHTIMQAEYELGYREDKPLKHVLPKWPVR